MNWRTFSLRTWLIAAAVVVLCLLALGFCAQSKRAETASDQATVADSRMGSAEVALDVVAQNTTANSAESAKIERAQDAIRSETDPARRDAVARQQLRCIQSPDGTC